QCCERGGVQLQHRVGARAPPHDQGLLTAVPGTPDTGRWSELRLVVQRPAASETAVWSVVVMSVDSGRRRDHLVARGTIPMSPGSAQRRQWGAALQGAWEAASKGQEPTCPLRGAEPGSPWGDDRGDPPPGS